MNYPQYYRKDGRCVKRESETTGREVRIPDTAKKQLPLILSDITYPTRDRFDQELEGMDQVDQDMWEQYIQAFIGRVEQDVKEPMIRYKLNQELKKVKP